MSRYSEARNMATGCFISEGEAKPVTGWMRFLGAPKEARFYRDFYPHSLSLKPGRAHRIYYDAEGKTIPGKRGIRYL